MRRLLPLLIPLAVTALAVGGRAQAPEVRFERADEVERHLPQSSVYEILEDRRGFLWFATREGLGRWDGYTMRTWRVAPFDAASLPGNVVTRMWEDGAGDLWVETQGTDRIPTGIARLVGPGHERVRRYGRPDARLIEGPRREAWLADRDSLYRFSRARDRFVGVGARVGRGAPLHGITRHDGTVWLATRGGGVERYEGARWRGRVVPFAQPWPEGALLGRLYEDRRGTLWLSGSRLGRLSADERRIETAFAPAAPPAVPGWDWGASEMVEDDDGWIWIATLDGVYRFRPDAPDRPERHTLLLPGGIATQNFVTALHRDRAGTLWAGTVWGLHRFDPHADRFRLLAHDPTDPASLGSGLVLSLHEDATGALWVGTLGGGLNRYDPATGRARRYPWGTPGGTSGSWIWALAGGRDGALWVATGAGLDRVDVRRPDRMEAVPVRHLTPAPESVYRVHVDQTDGSLWVGEFGGLLHRTAAGERVALRLPDSTGVEDVLAERSGVWVATSDGLYRLDRRTGRARRYAHDPADPASLTHDATLCLFRDSRGRLWVGTNSGLNRFDPATDGFTSLTAADGLPSDVVYALLEDGEGRLWISTNRGLARYDERAAPDRRLRAFTVADGVGNVEFNRRAAFRGRDGTLYFGGDRGVTAFHPRDIHDNPYRPPVVLTALHRATRAGATVERYVGGAPVEIAPEAYTFAFEFAALGFTNPPRQRYAVQMEGWDEGWVDLGAERRATYTNLPPGRYTFRVRAANEDGLWSAAGAAVPVVVRPWFWQTWWFRALVALVVLGAVAGGVWGASRARYRRALVRLEARRALEAERARISRDVHDEVGASLTEIAILSELARRAPGDGAAPHLDRIATTSRAMVGALGEIVWAVNPKNDRLPALAAYLREHAARYLEAAGLEARLAFPQPVPDRPVSAELRRNVFLVLKEALHNVVKHAGATYAEVTFAVEPGGLALTVHDDGCGFSSMGNGPGGDGAPVRASGGDGLGNLRRRAAEVGGVLAVTSAPGDGTTVHLTVPLPAAALQPPPSV